MVFIELGGLNEIELGSEGVGRKLVDGSARDIFTLAGGKSCYISHKVEMVKTRNMGKG